MEELKQRVSSATVYGSIQKLRRITQLIATERSLEWLIEIERDLFSEMRPKSKWDRVVLTEVIVEAGLTLIAEAETANKLTKLARARLVRNGLMQALLAAHPMRRKNFAALELGRSVVKQDGTWWIILTAAETKEKRADERPVEDYIGEAIDKYLQTYRPILGRGKSTTNALWLAETGAAMAESYVGELITETARLTLGVPVNPHMFRTAAATTSAIHAGDMPHLGSAVLHHTHPTVTLENYNRASSISAGRALREVIQRFCDKGT
jgi:site-specific recombinase XerD